MKGIILVVVLIITSLLNGQDFLTGDWGGIRTSLRNSGVDFEFVYTGEFFSVWDSDVDDKSTYLDNYDLTATFNLNTLLGWKGATLFTYFLGNTGGFPNDRVGTAGNMVQYKVFRILLPKTDLNFTSFGLSNNFVMKNSRSFWVCTI